MVIVKTSEQIEQIRISCQLLAEVMKEVGGHVRVGVTPKELDTLAEKLILEAGGKPAFKGYRAVPGGTPFPSTICASVNDTVVHGFGNSESPLQEGDIIGIDCGINLGGYYSDMARTFAVGQISEDLQKLLDVTKKSLENGIKVIKPGQPIRAISEAVQNTITPHGYGIVRGFAGHGVGLQVHEDPWIPNYTDPELEESLSVIMQPGHVFAIEPMITNGGADIEILSDGWTVQTLDRSYSAHFENTVLVTENGHEILTK
jgi:methionyl aminopeptidase